MSVHVHNIIYSANIECGTFVYGWILNPQVAHINTLCEEDAFLQHHALAVPVSTTSIVDSKLQGMTIMHEMVHKYQTTYVNIMRQERPSYKAYWI